MQFTIDLNSQSVQKLADIQSQTNQAPDTIISQGLSLYHQQLQTHRQMILEVDLQDDLVGEEYRCDREIELNWHHPSFYVSHS